MNANSITKVSVFGLGTMGVGIAQVFALANRAVRCFDPQASARDSAVNRIRQELEQTRNAGIIDTAAVEAALERLTICETEEDALRDAEFVTEAIIEDLGIKQELFPRMEHSVSPECILASNTSTYPMTEIAVSMRLPERAICTHWFNPGHIVPLVEVIPGQKTSEETTCTTLDLLEDIGKTAVRVRKEVPGFLVNRIQVALLREALNLLDQGVASAEDIDRAVQSSVGFRLATVGPLRVFDFAGHDVNAPVMDGILKEISSSREVPAIVRRFIQDGNLGVKTGKGIYDYSDTTPEKLREDRDQRFLKIKKLLYPPKES